GGQAKPRSLRLAARWADEYNLLMLTPDQCRELVPRVRDAWVRAERGHPTVSLMVTCIVGSDRVDLFERAHRVAEIQGQDASDPEAYLGGLPPYVLAGTVAEVSHRIDELEEAGIERLMLQYLTHDDLDGVDLIGELA